MENGRVSSQPNESWRVGLDQARLFSSVSVLTVVRCRFTIFSTFFCFLLPGIVQLLVTLDSRAWMV